MTGSDKCFFKRVDHVSLTVTDLDAAVEFYRRVFGAGVIYEMGPIAAQQLPRTDDGRDWTDAHIDVKDATFHIAMLRLADNLNMELFEYSAPDDAGTRPPRGCDVGSRHVCFEVEDLTEAVRYLEDNGCRAMSGPIEGGEGSDTRWWYLSDPFGNQFELVQYALTR